MNNERIQKATQILGKQGLKPEDARFLESLSQAELDAASPVYKPEVMPIKNIDINSELKKRLSERGETIEEFNARIEAEKEKYRQEERARLADSMNKNTALFFLKNGLKLKDDIYMRVVQKKRDIPEPTANTALCGKTGTGKTTEMYASMLKLSDKYALDFEDRRISYADKPRMLLLPWRGRMQDRLFWQPSEYHKELDDYFYTPFEWIFIDDLFIQEFSDPMAKSYFTRFIGIQWEKGAKFYYTCNATSVDKLISLFGDSTLYDRMKPEVMDFVRFSGKSFRVGK